MPFSALRHRLWLFSLCLPLTAHAIHPARALLNENRLDEAAAICRQIQVLSTLDTDAFAACAWVFFRLEKDSVAEGFMEKLRKGVITPEYQLLTAYSQMRKKNFEGAKESLASLSKEHPRGAYGLTIQELNAELYEVMGQFDTAAFIYKQVVGEDPARPRAHWALARYYLSRGELARAITHLEKTANLWPKHLGSRYNLGVLRLQEGNVQEAARWLAECYKINRADPGVLEQLGLLFEKRGAISDAVRYWHRALALSKTANIAKEKIAFYSTQAIDSLIHGQQFEKALMELQSRGKELNANPQLLLRRAIVYRNLGRYNKAISDLKVYMAKMPGDGSALRELGICYINRRNLRPATSYFLRAVELEPENGLNYAWLAYAFEAEGKMAEAKEAWKRSIQYLTEPDELARAKRRLASLKKRAPDTKDRAVEKDDRSEEKADDQAKKPAWKESGTQTGAQIPRY